MKKRMGLLALILGAVLALTALPAAAAETADRFVLAAEAGGKLVIPPEYVSYAPGSSIRDALKSSGHSFTGLEQGIVTAIDEVSGSFTRSDQTGSYDLTIPAASVTHYRFSENIGGSRPGEGLMELMTAMAEYAAKPADVRSAAKEAYQRACDAFVGITDANAAFYAEGLTEAMERYEGTLNGKRHAVTFTDSGNVCGSGYVITAENPYGKTWTDENADGTLELPEGEYAFHVERRGLHAKGSVTVSGPGTVAVSLPADRLLLDTDALRLSGSYTNGKDLLFEDSEFALGAWQERRVTVPVSDSFSGAVYVYAEYSKSIFSGTVPTLTAVYTMKNEAGTEMEAELPFESYTGGAYSVLAAEAQGNTLILRISSQGSDGCVYAQDYTVEFARIPTLKGITLLTRTARTWRQRTGSAAM